MGESVVKLLLFRCVLPYRQIAGKESIMDYQDAKQYYGAYGTEQAYEPLDRYTAKTFGWMFAGLLLTFAIALTGYVTGLVWYVFAIPQMIWILGIAELVVVLYLSTQINKVSVGVARGLFFTYSILNGVVFSAYFLLYALPSLVVVFGATAVFFGIMAAVGYFTRADLSNLRNFLVGGLIFLLLFWVAGIFFNLERFEIAILFSCCLLHMTLRRLSPIIRPIVRIRLWRRRRQFLPLCSCIWILSICLSICCGFLAGESKESWIGYMTDKGDRRFLPHEKG